MSAKKYDFDGVIDACSRGGYLSESLDNLQRDLSQLQRMLKELEELYHGIGKSSYIYKMYDTLFTAIGRASNYNYWNNSGLWEAIQNIVYKTNNLYTHAVQDKQEWEEEQRRKEEERQRKEEEERRRLEEQNNIYA